MYWRVRTNLPDRPGALAELAGACGRAGVNILALQIFGSGETVTDELVLRTPGDWGLPDIAELVEGAGGSQVSAMPCTQEALADQPTRYVRAARSVLTAPESFPGVVARLFDAEADAQPGPLRRLQDLMDLGVGDIEVQIRRAAPFTRAERERGAALANLVSDVLAAHAAASPVAVGGVERRMGGTAEVDLRTSPDGVAAYAGEVRVGSVIVGEATDTGARPVSVQVDPSWRRRGIGSRLLVTAARQVADVADELLVTTHADNRAVVPMVLAAGLRGRIRMSGDLLTVRVPVRELRGVAAG